MLTREMFGSMAMTLMPYKGTAVITLNANTASPITVTVYNAWLKQDTGGLSGYGGVMAEQAKTKIRFLDIELNPANNGYEIRAEDEIVFNGITYVVTDRGGNLISNRSTWDCDVQKKIT
jgi:hypothetical protein